jgi:transposase-like protein
MPTLSKLSKTAFHSEPAAFEYLEATLWPSGPVCPHCGVIGHATKLQIGPAKEGKRSARIGLWKCNEKQCRKQFTVKVGTVFEHGRIPLNKMLQAVYLLCSSKKGCSSHQLHRVLGITYKAAWFLSHRIREAMRDGSLTPIGGTGKMVEADETFFVNKKGFPKGSGIGRKMAVVSLVERDGGPLRAVVLDSVSRPDIERIVEQDVAEFDFRYNNRSAVGIEDSARATKALRGISGKRLTYR